MRMNRALLAGGIGLVLMAGLALSQDKAAPRGTTTELTTPHEAQTAAAPARAAKGNAEYPVICYLEQRGRTITVKAGPKGPLYSVKAADGKVLYENVSLERLSAQAPALGEFLKRAVAGAGGAKSDARLRIWADLGLR